MTPTSSFPEMILKAAFPDHQSRFPECLLYLFDNQIIHATPAANEEAYYSGKSIEDDLPKHFHMNYHLLITDYGYFLMEQRQEHAVEMDSLRKSSTSAESQAHSAIEQVNLLKAESNSSKKELRFAQIVSVISLLLSFASVIVQAIK